MSSTVHCVPNALGRGDRRPGESMKDESSVGLEPFAPLRNAQGTAWRTRPLEMCHSPVVWSVSHSAFTTHGQRVTKL